MKIKEIDSLPLFFKLGDFEIDKKKMYSRKYIVSDLYKTKYYPRGRFNKPIIL